MYKRSNAIANLKDVVDHETGELPRNVKVGLAEIEIHVVDSY